MKFVVLLALVGLASCRTALIGGDRARDVTIEYTFLDDHGKEVNVEVTADNLEQFGLSSDRSRSTRQRSDGFDTETKTLSVSTPRENARVFPSDARSTLRSLSFKDEPSVRFVAVDDPNEPERDVKFIKVNPNPTSAVHTRLVPVHVREHETDTRFVQFKPEEPEFERRVVRFEEPKPEFKTKVFQFEVPRSNIDTRFVQIEPQTPEFETKFVEFDDQKPEFMRRFVEVEVPRPEFETRFVRVQSQPSKPRSPFVTVERPSLHDVHPVAFQAVGQSARATPSHLRARPFPASQTSTQSRSHRFQAHSSSSDDQDNSAEK